MTDVSAALFMRSEIAASTTARRVYITKEGYFGLVPSSAKRSDRIILLSGGKTPYVVRKGRKGISTFIGDCYVHGYMNGEAWDLKRELQEFVFA